MPRGKLREVASDSRPYLGLVLNNMSIFNSASD